MKYILAIDQGTTSSRAILYNEQAQPIGSAQEEFEQFFPESGMVEHDAQEIWKTQLSVIREVIKEQSIDPADIAGIGITNQRETTLIWDRKTGKPVYHAIVWQDRRTASECEKLKKAGHEPLITDKTGLLIDAYFSATKIKWLLDNVQGLREKADKGELAFGTIDTWLVWNLTGGALHITDATNASRTLLFNIHSLVWDEELLDLFDIPSSLLPEVRQSSEIYGTTMKTIIGASIPIAGIAGDQQAALFGQMCISEGMAKCTYGTGCFLIMNTGKRAIRSGSKLLSTIAWQLNGEVTYALEGSVFMGGATIQWLRDGLKIIDSAADSEELAATVDDNGGVVFVPALTGLGAPHWDSSARGSFFGISRGTTRAHIARAALESICLQVNDVLDAMKTDSGDEIKELRVDGGATSNNLLVQLQSDFSMTKVIRPTNLETTALGAAYLAGLATGIWSLNELNEKWKIERTFTKSMTDDKVSKVKIYWAKAIARSKHWINQV